jgi:exopolysaccharide production protein ExoQ
VPPISIFSRIAVTLILLYMTISQSIFSGAAFSNTPELVMPSSGSLFSRSIWIISTLCAAAVALPRAGDVIKVLRRVNVFLIAFYALAAASVMWSIQPAVTLVRLVPMTACALTGLSLATGTWHYTHFQRAIRPVLTLVLVGSVIFLMEYPLIGIEQAKSAELLGAWKGLTSQKNIFGSISAVSLVLWWHAWLSKEMPRWRSTPWLLLAAVCVVKSRSSTSIVAGIFSMVLMTMLLWHPKELRRYVPYMVVAFTALILVYSMAVLDLLPGSGILLSPITLITGKDLTFTGRTAIWAIIHEHIALAPLLGSGYGAYWVEVPGSPSVEMLRRLYFYPSESHNGYLDITNDLGAVGAAVLVGYLITFVRQSLQIFAQVRFQGTLYLTLVFLLMIANLSESRWLNMLDYTFPVMTFAIMVMARHLVELGPQRSAAARVRPRVALRGR